MLKSDNIIIIMNFTINQSCNHAVFKSNKHVKKIKKLKNLHLNLLYICYNFSAICNNYLILITFIFLI